MGSGKKRVAIVGYGNVGMAALDAVLLSGDLELAGMVRRQPLPIPGKEDVRVAGSVAELGEVHGAILTVPTRQVSAQAAALLENGVATVDGFDLHGEPMVEHRQRLGAIALQHGATAVVGAGWDPGTDSILRVLLAAMAPEGKTTTTFGPGMSMGHTVAAKAIPGVRDAVSLTLPAGPGVHAREVHVEVEDPSLAPQVEKAIQEDPYFVNDATRVVFSEDISNHVDPGHGVSIERSGTSAGVPGQRFHWEMRIQNPALTAQMMVAAIRAAFRQDPGAYTLIEIPAVDFLPGERERWVRELV